MNNKKNQWLFNFLPIMSMVFGIPVIIGISYSMLTQIKMDYFLMGYWWILSLIVSAVMTIYQTIRERYQTRKIKTALQLLIAGNYSADLFLKMFSEETPEQISKTLDLLFMQLQEKMMLMAEEAVQASHDSESIRGQTREEIVKEERQRIARELHDSVSQQLFAASMMLSALREHPEGLTDPNQKQLKIIEQAIHEAQSEMRALLLHLRPTLLDGKTLKQGIEYLLNELSTKIPLTLTYKIQDATLAPVIEDHLFRVVQELLSNVLRHAHASHLEVFLLQTDDQVTLRMIDDGVGFSPQNKKPGSFGLTNIQERVESIGGSMRVISFPKQGTNVEIKVPLTIGGIERDSVNDSR